MKVFCTIFFFILMQYIDWPQLNYSTLRVFMRNPSDVLNMSKFRATPAMTLGTLCHCQAMGLPIPGSTRLWSPPINSKTNKPYGETSQAYQDAKATLPTECEVDGRTVFTEYYSQEDIDTAEIVGARVRARLSSLVDMLTARYEVPMHNAAIKARCDILADGALIELKTTAQFERTFDAISSGTHDYINQVSFYNTLYICDYAYIVLCETEHPYRISIFDICQSAQYTANKYLAPFIQQYQWCKEHETFPNKYNTLQVIH